jgi:hypothetical protein
VAEGKRQRLTIKMITFDDIENVLSSILGPATERERAQRVENGLFWWVTLCAE